MLEGQPAARWPTYFASGNKWGMLRGARHRAGGGVRMMRGAQCKVAHQRTLVLKRTGQFCKVEIVARRRGLADTKSKTAVGDERDVIAILVTVKVLRSDLMHPVSPRYCEGLAVRGALPGFPLFREKRFL